MACAENVRSNNSGHRLNCDKVYKCNIYNCTKLQLINALYNYLKKDDPT